MKVTGGKLKGVFIKCPPGVIRPAMDRMRESLFSILGDLTGKSFLDLFSGSGMIALEAASRGSRDIEICEKDKGKATTVIENVSNSQRLGFKIHCHFMSAEYFVKRCKRSFDIIFLDPPFPYEYSMDLIQRISEGALLSTGGTLLLHHPKEKKALEAVGDFCITDTRVYGRSVVDFYRYKSEV